MVPDVFVNDVVFVTLVVDGKNFLKIVQLLHGDHDGKLKHRPDNIFGARWSSQRSMIPEDS